MTRIFWDFNSYFLRFFAKNFKKSPLFSLWKEKSLAKKKTARKCMVIIMDARTSFFFSWIGKIKKTGIIKTFLLLLLKFHSQVNSQPKFLSWKSPQCTTNRKDSMPGDPKSIHTVVATINRWLECTILHHNKRYYKQLRPIPCLIVGNRARNTAQFTAQ